MRDAVYNVINYYTMGIHVGKDPITLNKPYGRKKHL